MTNIEARKQSSKFFLVAVLGSTFLIGIGLTVFFYKSMGGDMVMPSGRTMSMMWMPMPGKSWFASLTMFLAMWTAMMVAMMMPSFIFTVLHFRQQTIECKLNEVGLRTSLFVSGYFVLWTALGIPVFIVGTKLASRAMFWSLSTKVETVLCGIILVLAGSLQVSSWKQVVLRKCRIRNRRKTPPVISQTSQALLEGLSLGGHCGLCCLGPMLAQCALGLMNPLAMLIVTGVITTERLLSNPKGFVRVSGALGILFGILMCFGI